MPTVDIPAAQPGLTGFLALPDSGRGPGVVVIQEWWGIVPHIRTVADRLAAAGFVALAPDLYRGQHTTEPDEAGKLMMGLRISDAAGDIAATVDYLVRSGHLTGTRVGAVGFCMGGGLALLAPTVGPGGAAKPPLSGYPGIDCSVAFYPAMPWPDYAPAWAGYADKEALIHECEADRPSTGQVIADYAASIAAGGGVAVIEDYPGTQHAFFNDDRPEVYDAAAARLAWERTVDFLHRRLDAPLA